MKTHSLISKFKNTLGFINYFIPPPLNKYLLWIRGVNFKNLSSVWIGSFSMFDTSYPEKIIIGSDVIISFGVKIICHFEPTKSLKSKFNYKVKAVTICDGVFIGAGVIIYPGVKIGKNSIISAGVVLNHSVPSNTLIKPPRNSFVSQKIL